MRPKKVTTQFTSKLNFDAPISPLLRRIEEKERQRERLNSPKLTIQKEKKSRAKKFQIIGNTTESSEETSSVKSGKRGLLRKNSPDLHEPLFAGDTFDNSQLRKKEATEEQRDVFADIYKLLDFDNKGYISIEEIRRLVGLFSYMLPMKMEDMIMFEVDKNGDGMIQFDEFMDLVGNIEGDTVREKKATLKAFKELAQDERHIDLDKLLLILSQNSWGYDINSLIGKLNLKEGHLNYEQAIETYYSFAEFVKEAKSPYSSKAGSPTSNSPRSGQKHLQLTLQAMTAQKGDINFENMMNAM